MKSLKIIIIMGMSGAGKTTTIQSFEEMNYMCVENLPPYLLTELTQKISENNQISKVVIELNAKYYSIEEILSNIDLLMENDQFEVCKLFLDATDEVLVSRYKEARRRHPYETNTHTLSDAIARERSVLKEYRNWKRVQLIDTSEMSSKALTQKLKTQFQSHEESRFVVNFMSFGFKHGTPVDADYVIDVRYLPNPFYIEELKKLTGMDNAVFDYVFSFEESQTLYTKLQNLLTTVLIGIEKEGRNQIVIAIGCTGGQHRSVSFARKFTEEFAAQYNTYLFNRDIDKNKH